MKADILTLAQTLSLEMADSFTIDQFYDEVIEDLAKTHGPFTNVNLIQPSAFDVVAQNWEYSLPPEGVRILNVFYGDQMLMKESTKTLDSIYPSHRDGPGEPTIYTVDEVNERSFRVISPPEMAGEPFIFLSGAPLGVDYPPNGIAVAYTETRQDLPSYWNLPIALAILAREFQRESDHRDSQFAQSCMELSEFMIGALTRDAS